MSPVLRALTKLLLFTTFIFAFYAGKGQANFSIHLKDSIQATDSSVWLNNDLLIRNNQSTDLLLKVEIKMPSNWQVIGKNPASINIKPGQSGVVPISLIRTPQALAKWMPAEIIVTNTLTNEIIRRSFVIRSNPIAKFSISTMESDMLVSSETKFLDFDVLIKNTGNIDQVINIDARNDFFVINSNFNRSLDAGEEYHYKFRVRINDMLRKRLMKERIKVSAKNSNYKLQSVTFLVDNVSSASKQHLSPHPSIPIELETGVLYFSGQYAYYGAIRGSIPLKNDKKFNFSYRTKQIGIANSIEKNTFSLEYITKKWRLYAGEQSDLASFYSFGQGFSVTHTSPKKTETNLSAIIHYKNNPFKSDIYSGSVKHNIKSVSLKHLLAVNTLPDQHRFGFVIANDVNLFNKDNFKLALKLNAGQDHYLLKAPNMPDEKAGTALGYTFTYSLKVFDFSSDLFIASDRYPGALSGLKSQNHSVNLKAKSFSLGAFYQYNYTRNQNILFRDTVFNTNFFDYDYERYGGQVSWQANKELNMSMSAGKYKQTGSFSNLLQNARFLDYSALYKKGRNFSIRFNTTNGYNPSYGTKKESIWITRSSFSINFKNMGFRAFYVRTPTGRAGNVPDSLPSVIETYNLTPYVRFTLFRMLSMDLSYSFSKSLYDNAMATYGGVNFVYTNRRIGLESRLVGNIPITNTSSNFSGLANNSMVFYVKKSLNLPNVFKKQYYDLKVIIFKDDNGNSIMDINESPLPNTTISISDRIFITNSKGVIKFDNIEKKYYILDMTVTKVPRGYIPGGGNLQFVNVEKNMTYFIPYQKGMVISGKIKVTLDSLGKTTFTPYRLKITVSDTLGNFFKTLADPRGEYYVNVPPGTYKVSLNPDVFSKDLKPVQMSYTVEVGLGKEEQTVNFEIIETLRKIRFLKKP